MGRYTNIMVTKQLEIKYGGIMVLVVCRSAFPIALNTSQVKCIRTFPGKYQEEYEWLENKNKIWWALELIILCCSQPLPPQRWMTSKTIIEKTRMKMHQFNFIWCPWYNKPNDWTFIIIYIYIYIWCIATPNSNISLISYLHVIDI